MVRLGRGREIEGEVPRAVALKVLTQTTSGIAKKAKEKGRECERCTHVREGKGRRGREESVL